MTIITEDELEIVRRRVEEILGDQVVRVLGNIRDRGEMAGIGIFIAEGGRHAVVVSPGATAEQVAAHLQTWLDMKRAQ